MYYYAVYEAGAPNMQELVADFQNVGYTRCAKEHV